jgi:hypothetical protein
MQILQQQGLLIEQQMTYEPNPLYATGDVTNLLNTHSVYARLSQRQHQYTSESIIVQLYSTLHNICTFVPP